jgi:hypothetical protein
MFTLFFDHAQRVLLIRYSGSLTGADLRELDVAARAFIRSQGRVPSIVDLSAVTAVDVPTEAIRIMGSVYPAMGEEIRVYVAPDDIAFGLVRLYAAYQELAGHPKPMVVRSFAEAVALLGCDDPQFLPWIAPQ